MPHVIYKTGRGLDYDDSRSALSCAIASSDDDSNTKDEVATHPPSACTSDTKVDSPVTQSATGRESVSTNAIKTTPPPSPPGQASITNFLTQKLSPKKPPNCLDLTANDLPHGADFQGEHLPTGCATKKGNVNTNNATDTGLIPSESIIDTADLSMKASSPPTQPGRSLPLAADFLLGQVRTVSSASPLSSDSSDDESTLTGLTREEQGKTLAFGALSGHTRSTRAATKLKVPRGVKGGPLLLMQAVVNNQSEVLSNISELNVDTSSTGEVTASFVLSMLHAKQTASQISDALKISSESHRFVVRTIGTMNTLARNGHVSSGLTEELSKPILRIRGLFNLSSPAKHGSDSEMESSEEESEDGSDDEVVDEVVVDDDDEDDDYHEADALERLNGGPLILLRAALKKQINILPRTTRYFTKVDSLSTVGKALACVLTLLAEGLDPSGVADALEIHSSSKHLVLTTIRSIRCLFQKGRTTSGNLNEKLRNPVETLRGLHRDEPLATEHSSSVASPTTTPPMSALAPNSDSETETEDEEDDIVIHRFEHWMSVREKLEKMGMRVKDEASVGYIFIVGENGPKENGILDKDYFLTIDALKDYVKRTYGWYGTENGWYEPKKDDIVRLTREGRAYVQSKLTYELNDYFVICSYDSKNHTCIILPATKEGTFDSFDCRQHDPNIEGRDRWVCVSSCEQLEIDERYVYKILESKRVNDGWNVVDGALTSSGTKRPASPRERSKKAAKTSKSISPRETSSSPEDRVSNDSSPRLSGILFGGREEASMKQHQLEIPGADAISGGPRILVEAVARHHEDVLPKLTHLRFNKSSSVDITIAYVLSRLSAGEGGTQIMENLNIPYQSKSPVSSTISHINAVLRDGPDSKRGLNQLLKKAVNDLRDQFINVSTPEKESQKELPTSANKNAAQSLLSGPRVLIECVAEKREEILARLDHVTLDRSSIFEITIAYVLSQLSTGDQPANQINKKIMEDLDIDVKYDEKLNSTLHTIRILWLEGEKSNRGLDSKLKRAIFDLRGQFVASSKKVANAAGTTTDTSRSRDITPAYNSTFDFEAYKSKCESQVNKLRDDMANHKMQLDKLCDIKKDNEKLRHGLMEELECPIKFGLPDEPVIAVDGVSGTIYDRGDLNAHWDAQRQKKQDLTWPSTNEKVKGDPMLISCPQLKGAISFLSSTFESAPVSAAASIATDKDPAQEKVCSLREELHEAEMRHLEEQSKVTVKLQGELAKRLEMLSEMNSLRTLEKDLAESKKDLAESKKDLAESKKDLAESKKDLAESKKDLAESKAETSNYLVKISALQRELSSLESRNDVLEANATTYQNKISSLSNQVSTLESSLAEKQKDIDHLKSESEKLSKKLEGAKSPSPVSSIQHSSIGTTSVELMTLELTAMKAIAASFGATTLIDSTSHVDAADLKGHFGKCNAALSILHQPDIVPLEKAPLIEMARAILQSMIRSHASTVEAGDGDIVVAVELTRKCRLIQMILTDILKNTNWSETDGNRFILESVIGLLNTIIGTIPPLH